MADTVTVKLVTPRTVLTDADAVIARVRAHAGEPPIFSGDDTATARRCADEWLRHLDALIAESELAESVRDFRQRWPALVAWRERVLANRRKAKPVDVAAALESLALECTLAGEHHLAAKTQQAAINVMRARGPRGVRVTRAVVPLRSAEPSAAAQSA